MALKPITLRLDEEEYEELKKHLSKFGDPDINVAYVLRSYIRDLNRVFPYLVNSEWDLKNYFGLIGFWLKQFVAITDIDTMAKAMVNPWAYWNAAGSSSADAEAGVAGNKGKGHRHPRPKEGGDNEEQQ